MSAHPRFVTWGLCVEGAALLLLGGIRMAAALESAAQGSACTGALAGLLGPIAGAVWVAVPGAAMLLGAAGLLTGSTAGRVSGSGAVRLVLGLFALPWLLAAMVALGSAFAADGDCGPGLMLSVLAATVGLLHLPVARGYRPPQAAVRALG